ncbi:AraC family transcriptional regulator [Dyadobacter jejuensis]|nr:AraC family transcriptional regulator [Dyadobacter jejuensis]
MKLLLKNTENLLNDRLNVIKREVACLDSSWHYHPQFELIYISQSNGIRFVGDSVSQFFPGDLVLVGPNLPHLWRNDPSYYKEDESKKVETIILKFTKNFIGEGTFQNPMFGGVNHMLEQAKYGISFGKNTSRRLHQELHQMVNLSQAEQSIKMLEVLFRLSVAEDKLELSSSDMRQYTTENSQRIDMVLKYISDNHAEEISLNDVADIACMTPNSFCRFFKKMTNKSFVQFLNEVRIRDASRLLAQEDLPISEICDIVGYKSITNFNKQFKQIVGSTPKDYRLNNLNLFFSDKYNQVG